MCQKDKRKDACVTRTDLYIDQTSWASARPSFSRDEKRTGPPLSIPFCFGGACAGVMVEKNLATEDRVELRSDLKVMG